MSEFDAIINGITMEHPFACVNEALLHREINTELRDRGCKTVSTEDLAHYMELKDYRWCLDACGDRIWRGLGLLSDREEERAVELERLYPASAI